MNKQDVGSFIAVITILTVAVSVHAERITTLSETEGKPITIEVTPGENWTGQGKMLLMKFDVTPQMAFWIEDMDNNLVDTLYVTEKTAKQTWDGASGRNKDDTFRPYALPYWMHKAAQQGVAAPTKNNPLPDAVTAASPEEKEIFIIHTKANAEGQEIYVLMEVNNSFDENDTYPNKSKRKAAEYNGQPAVVYRAQVHLARPGHYEMQLIGHSSWTGEDGELSEDVSTLTTAVNIIEKAVVIVE